MTVKDHDNHRKSTLICGAILTALTNVWFEFLSGSATQGPNPFIGSASDFDLGRFFLRFKRECCGKLGVLQRVEGFSATLLAGRGVEEIVLLFLGELLYRTWKTDHSWAQLSWTKHFDDCIRYSLQLGSIYFDWDHYILFKSSILWISPRPEIL